MTVRLFIAACLLGMVAFWFARGLGIPAWRSWEPGDAWDIGTAVWAAVLLLGDDR
jgi:hypothetical protein